MISSELDPLVGLDTRHTQELHTLHAVTRGLCVVIAAHTNLSKITRQKEENKGQLHGKKGHLRFHKNEMLEIKKESEHFMICEANDQPGWLSLQCCLAPLQNP